MQFVRDKQLVWYLTKGNNIFSENILFFESYSSKLSVVAVFLLLAIEYCSFSFCLLKGKQKRPPIKKYINYTMLTYKED